MKKISLTLFAFLTASFIFSQNINLDSLKNVIAGSTVDTAKIDAYIKLAGYFNNGNIDSSISYAEKGIKLAKAINHKKGEMILYQPYGIAYAMKGDLNKAKNIFEQGFDVAAEINEVQSQINFLNNIAIVYNMLKQQDSTLKTFNRVLNLSIQKKYKKGIVAAYNNIGIFMMNHNKYYTAIKNFQNARSVYNTTKFKDIYFKREFFISLADSYLNSGVCFQELKEYKKAIEQYKKAFDNYQSANDSLGIARVYTNIGTVFLLREIPDSAIYYVKKSIDLSLKINFLRDLGSGFSNLGQAFFLLKNYEQSIKYYKKGIDAYRKSRPDKLHKSYFQIAEVYVATGNFKLAEKYLNDAEDLTKNIYDLIGIYKVYRKLYEKSSKFKKALYYANLLDETKDSLYNLQNISLVQDLQTKYETEKKEAENQKLKFENNLQKAELTAYKTKQILILTSALLLIAILSVIYFINKKKYADKLNELKFKEIGRNNNQIARDLHDGIGGYHAALKMMLESKKELEKEIDIIDKVQKTLRFQLHRLKAPDIFDKDFDFVNEIKTFVRFIENIAEIKINLQINNTEELENIRYSIKMHIYNILKELLTNTMKYADATHVDIELFQNRKQLFFKYKDNGKGFDISRQLKGEGIKNIKQRVEQIDANIELNSIMNKGTYCNISIPLRKTLFFIKKAV